MGQRNGAEADSQNSPDATYDKPDMPDVEPMWNELAPEAYADEDDPRLVELTGKVILVRLNWIEGEDTHTGTEVTAGQVLRANRQEGLVLSTLGAEAGVVVSLPLVIDALSPLDPGVYGLSDETAIRNPDFLIAFDVHRPLN
jgi:hypothetical protein